MVLSDERIARMLRHPRRDGPMPPPIDDEADEDEAVEEPVAFAGSRFSLRALTPGLTRLLHYRRAWLRSDVFVGVAVAAYLVPQVMAYAGMVGVPAVAALWTSLAALVVYALLGSSRCLSVGPEATVALLSGSVVGRLAHGDPGRAMALAAALSLIVAGWLFVAWLVRLGAVSDLLSHPLLIGYLTGAGVLMMAGQLGRITGTHVSGDSVFSQVRSFVRVAGHTGGPTLWVGLGTLVVLFAVHLVRPSWPAPLIGVALATITSAAVGLREHGVAVLGHVPAGLPTPGLPRISTSDIEPLLVAGLGVAVVAFSDNMIGGRAFARRGDRFDANTELVALAGVHVATGLLHGFPVSSSGTRTALAVAGKVRSQLYSLVAAGVVLAVLLFAGPLLKDLPLPALAAVVIYAAVHLIQPGEYRWLWGFRRSEFVVALVTCLGTLVFGILTGVGVAVSLSVAEMVARLSRPPDAIEGLVPGLAGMHDVDDYPEARTVPGLVVYRYDAPLFFVNAEDFRRAALSAVTEYDRPGRPVQWLVLNVEANMHIDVTAARTLCRLHRDLVARGITLGLVRVKHDLERQLDRAGLLTLIPPEMIFPTLPTMLAAYWARFPDAHDIDEEDAEDAIPS